MTAHNPVVEAKIQELIALSKSEQDLSLEECARLAEQIRGTADRVVPRLTNAEMFKINAAMRNFRLRHNSLEPVEDLEGRLYPGVKPSFRYPYVLPRPMNARDWEFCMLLAGHVARPWRIVVTVHTDMGDVLDDFISEPIVVELKYQYVEQLIDTIIKQIKGGINDKYIRHTEWVAEVWHHKADGTPTRNKRKTKRRKT